MDCPMREIKNKCVCLRNMVDVFSKCICMFCLMDDGHQGAVKCFYVRVHLICTICSVKAECFIMIAL